MNYYRLYYVKDGHFAGFDGFDAEDDVAAVRQGDSLADGRHAELWCGKRKVKIFNALAQAAHPARDLGLRQAFGEEKPV